VTADENTNTSANWSVTAYALCGTATP
jgi:hypothetical protein